VHLSIGVACLVPGMGAKHQDLIAAADKALYQAKHLGRNRIALAETCSGNLAPDPDVHLDDGNPGEGDCANQKRSAATAE
jgi:hypothetical protein